MTQRPVAALTLLGALMVPALTACTADRTGATPNPSSETTATVSASPNPPSSSPTAQPPKTTADPAGAPEPAAAVKDYVAMQDYLSQNPSIPLERLAWTARGEALKDAQILITLARGKEEVLEGATSVSLNSSEYKGDNKHQVTACLDMSHAFMKDKASETVGPSGRPTKFSYTYGVLRANDLRYYVVTQKIVKPSC